jgi:hypothetical protein
MARAIKLSVIESRCAYSIPTSVGRRTLQWRCAESRVTGGLPSRGRPLRVPESVVGGRERAPIDMAGVIPTSRGRC